MAQYRGSGLHVKLGDIDITHFAAESSHYDTAEIIIGFEDWRKAYLGGIGFHLFNGWKCYVCHRSLDPEPHVAAWGYTEHHLRPKTPERVIRSRDDLMQFINELAELPLPDESASSLTR